MNPDSPTVIAVLEDALFFLYHHAPRFRERMDEGRDLHVSNYVVLNMVKRKAGEVEYASWGMPQ